MESHYDLIEKLRIFTSEREWEQYHDPKNLAMLMASEVGELVGELRWLSNGSVDQELGSGDRRRRIEEELGDVMIAVMLFADRVGIDPISAAMKKLKLNALRYPADKSRGLPDRPLEK